MKVNGYSYTIECLALCVWKRLSALLMGITEKLKRKRGIIRNHYITSVVFADVYLLKLNVIRFYSLILLVFYGT